MCIRDSNNATLPFVLALADHGPRAALLANPHLRRGLNVSAGKVVEPHVAHALGYDLADLDRTISNLAA